MAHRAIGPGSVVASRFRLEDLLDEHSGARFWRATDLTLARNVAIHVLASDDPRGAALLTAARTSATVSEAHLLRVLDALEEGDLVHVVFTHGGGRTSTATLSLTAAPLAAGVEIWVHGDAGRLVLLPPLDAAVAAHQVAVEELTAAAMTGGAPACDVVFGRDVVAVLATVQRALASGRRETVAG